MKEKNTFNTMVVSIVLGLVLAVPVFGNSQNEGIKLEGSSFSVRNTDGLGIIHALPEKEMIYAADTGQNSGYSEKTLDDIEKAAVEMRNKMKLREESIEVTVSLPSDATDQEIMDAQKLILTEAYKETGIGDEGSYLDLQTLWIGGENLTGTINGDMIEWTFPYTMSYYTSLEQEEELTARIEQAYEEMVFPEDSSDLDKIWEIYQYVASHAVYDYEHLSDENYLLQYTPYAALCQGTSVCQGFSLLLYRMLWDYKLENHCVEGVSEGENHIWNIVLLDGLYYNCDVTWDASTFDHCSYFLKSDETFSYEHTRSQEFSTTEFYEKYPMTHRDYKFVPSLEEYDINMTMIVGDRILFDDDLYEEMAEGLLDHPVNINLKGTAVDVEGDNMDIITAVCPGRGLFTITAKDESGLSRKTLITVISKEEAAVLPEDVYEIQEEAFESTDLEAILIMDGCNEIGSRAFANDSTLTYVYIPDSVTEIAESAFEESTNVNIFCYGQSYAQDFAVRKGIPYRILAEESRLFDEGSDTEKTEDASSDIFTIAAVEEAGKGSPENLFQAGNDDDTLERADQEVTFLGGTDEPHKEEDIIAAASVSISKQPQNVMVAPGSTALFTVTATGTGLTYQWQTKTSQKYEISRRCDSRPGRNGCVQGRSNGCSNAETQKAMWFMDNMNFTQVPGGAFSHQ